MNLQLSLKGKWFEMTDPDGKTEDYRDITPYWFRRFFHASELNKSELNELIEKAQEGRPMGWFGEWELIFPKTFTTNTMTLGYPKSTDTAKIKVYKHAGIEIGTGKPEWGAEPNKLYFVIKHGAKIK